MSSQCLRVSTAETRGCESLLLGDGIAERLICVNVPGICEARELWHSPCPLVKGLQAAGSTAHWGEGLWASPYALPTSWQSTHVWPSDAGCLPKQPRSFLKGGIVEGCTWQMRYNALTGPKWLHTCTYKSSRNPMATVLGYLWDGFAKEESRSKKSPVRKLMCCRVFMHANWQASTCYETNERMIISSEVLILTFRSVAEKIEISLILPSLMAWCALAFAHVYRQWESLIADIWAKLGFWVVSW